MPYFDLAAARRKSLPGLLIGTLAGWAIFFLIFGLFAAPAAAERNLPGTTVFSESQARTHVEQRGYTRLRRMEKGADGLWTGTANKGGILGTFSIEKMGKVNFVPAA